MITTVQYHHTKAAITQCNSTQNTSKTKSSTAVQSAAFYYLQQNKNVPFISHDHNSQIYQVQIKNWQLS